MSCLGVLAFMSTCGFVVGAPAKEVECVAEVADSGMMQMLVNLTANATDRVSADPLFCSQVDPRCLAGPGQWYSLKDGWHQNRCNDITCKIRCRADGKAFNSDLGPGYGEGKLNSCQAAPTASPTPSEASAEDDPHVTSLAGEKFTIGTPSTYTLLRLPKNEQEPALFELRANVSEEPHAPCKLYIKSIELVGEFMRGSVAQVLPLARDKAGSNTAGSVTQRPFTLVVQSGGTSASTSWDRAAQKWFEGYALSPQVDVRATVKDELEGLQEGEMFDFTIGSKAHVVIQQGSHQALNIKLIGIGGLGEEQIGGLLGTDKHSREVEKPTERCLASSVDPAGARLWAYLSSNIEKSSMMAASW